MIENQTYVLIDIDKNEQMFYYYFCQQHKKKKPITSQMLAHLHDRLFQIHTYKFEPETARI